MIGSVGIPELLVVLFIGVLWLIPIAAAVWALVTLQRVHASQQSMAATLENVERLLRGGRAPE